ncbi:helix-turn-helix domain-containing protein [Haloactinospora alba]|uniref:helix-turn-helix domain-containing protein n=1 Tax=Haloactinospora alba TaxID=405555 RepID=UPI00114D6C2A|nr:helix-turn-helix domain-containing protein [Haloactinospora alba]
MNVGARRRTPGLRREEVAALSGVSLAWYTWLEQGRVATSRQVIDAVARALRLEAAQHRHALELAGFHAHGRDETTAGAGSRLARLIDGWNDVPAVLLDWRMDILHSNPAYREQWPEPEAVPPPGATCCWR